MMAAHGRLDILFNNAGVSFPGNVENITVEIRDRELGVHAKGVFLGTRTAIPVDQALARTPRRCRCRGSGSVPRSGSCRGGRPPVRKRTVAYGSYGIICWRSADASTNRMFRQRSNS